MFKKCFLFILFFMCFIFVACEKEIEDEEETVELLFYTENEQTYVNLGRYPQTVVSDTSLIEALNIISETNSLGYIEYNGEEYKKEGSNYYKVELIKWRVLESNNGTYKLVSEMLLDSQQFYTLNEERLVNGKKVYVDNYEYSNVRAWLNGYDGSSYNVDNYINRGFIDVAFTEEERKLINTTLVDNGKSLTLDSSNDYLCNDTNDKLYLLSIVDLTNTSYGFVSSSTAFTSTRQAKATNYAIAKGLYVDVNNGNSDWYLRSKVSNQYFVHYVGTMGFINPNTVDLYLGVRVALEITIK